ncbi:phage virion morphogenesis protein [Snodgrassella sp. CFCC 13594]|uniref:phage virion morphogenesis protein n=1 Tax=Snodgrassella sp. CFCC 13594 TaxID=1775559 RepID=UPI00082C851A|nr:phage virion morphogenesis protein [Snodgrassella sp. CFCC 13594]
MAYIEIKISNENEVLAQIERLIDGVTNLSPLMRNISGTMYSAVMQNFDAGGRPAWLGLKYRVGKPLTDTGRLRGSISEYSDNGSAVVGTNSIYAAIHNFGGQAGRGRSVTIPARPFMMITPQDEADILDDVQKYFQSIMH